MYKFTHLSLFSPPPLLFLLLALINPGCQVGNLPKRAGSVTWRCVEWTATQITVTLHKTISYIRSSYGISENITCTVIHYLHSLSRSWHKVRTQTQGFLADRSFKYYWYCMPVKEKEKAGGVGSLFVLYTGTAAAKEDRNRSDTHTRVRERAPPLIHRPQVPWHLLKNTSGHSKMLKNALQDAICGIKSSTGVSGRPSPWQHTSHSRWTQGGNKTHHARSSRIWPRSLWR